MITGEIGAGKTTVCRTLLIKLNLNIETIAYFINFHRNHLKLENTLVIYWFDSRILNCCLKSCISDIAISCIIKSEDR